MFFYRTPRGSISKSEEVKDFTAPLVAYFSGRGPNGLIADILKVHKLKYTVNSWLKDFKLQHYTSNAKVMF